MEFLNWLEAHYTVLYVLLPFAYIAGGLIGAWIYKKKAGKKDEPGT